MGDDALERVRCILTRDARGTLAYAMHSLWLRYILLPTSTILNRLRAWLWNVEVGSGCKFYGRVQFIKAPGSRIVIGSDCRFRSSFESNAVGLNRPCSISTHHKDAVVKIGNTCAFSGTVIAARQSISIGNGTLCGANVTITDFDWHHTDPSLRSRGEGGSASAPVVIEDNVWLGLNVVVLKGVTIGSNSVVAAGSVVTQSIPGNVLAGGVPARFIRRLGDLNV